MKLRLLISSVLLLGAACATAQNTSTDSAATHVAVVVSDDRGAPLRDLSAGDFTVEVGGKVQPVVSAQIPAISPAATLPEGTFGNVNYPAGRGPIVIVFDAIHTRYLDERQLRGYVVKFLAAAAEHNVPVSLLVMSSTGLQSFHDYRTSSSTLAAALRSIAGHPQPQEANPPDSADVSADAARLQDFLKGSGANNIASSEPLHTNINAILGMFHNVADAVAGIPGRKTLLWITAAVPFAVDDNTKLISSPLTNTPGGLMGNDLLKGPQSGTGIRLATPEALITDKELKRLYPVWEAAMDALFRAQMAVVPIEARGPEARSLYEQMYPAMKKLAALTGGHEIRGLDDPFASLQSLFDQNAGAYDLAVLKQGSACKTEWCALRITVKRPGAHITAPQGFFRPGHPDKGEAKDLQAAALASPLEFTGVPFLMRWVGMEAAGKNRKVAFAVRIDSTSGVIDAANSQFDLDIAVRAIPVHGESGHIANFSAGGKLPPEALKQIAEQGLVVKNALELPPGDYQIKIVVRDNFSGKTGSVTVPLSIS